MTDKTTTAQAASESALPEQTKFDRLYNRTFKGYGLDAERLAHAELFWKEGYKLGLLSKLRAPVADERAAFDDETTDLLLRAIDLLAPISEGKAQTSADGLFSKTRERAATITDARRVLSFALPMLRRVHAALASAPVAGEAQQPAEYQRRCRPTWENARVGWTEWERCTAEQAAECEKATLVHDWQYEVRRLYTAPKGSSVAMPIEQRCQNWESLKEQLNSADWTVSESVSYRGFFMLGVEAAIEFYAAPQASEANGQWRDLALKFDAQRMVFRDLLKVVAGKLAAVAGARDDEANKMLDMARDALASSPGECLKAQASEAYTYARNLAVTMWEKRFKQDAPEWKPCEDLIGVLTQIDNMVARLVVPQASEAVRDAGIAASEDVAPWPDYAGNQIRHGDRIRHPEGLEGVVVRLPGYADAHDAWCVAYRDRTVSRLSLQIGERGQAVVQTALSAQPGAQKESRDAE